MKIVRILALLVGFGTVAWQIMQLATGNGQNMFLIADIIVGLYLGGVALIPDARKASIHMFAGFGLMSGIYLVATLGTPTVTGAMDAGAISTLIGLIATLPCLVWLGRRLTLV